MTPDLHEWRAVNYVVHDVDGNILRSGTCTRRDVPLQAQGENEAVLETEYYCPGSAWRICDGAPVAIPENTQEELP